MTGLHTPILERAPEKPPEAGASAEYPVAQAARIASRFDIASPIEVYDFAEKGNINRHTFLVESGTSDKQEYLLQQVNQQVFFRPRNVMASMIAAIEAQKSRIGEFPPDIAEGWEAITLIPARDGSRYLEVVDRRGVNCWRLMIKIPESRTFKSLGEITDPVERLRVAREAGRGLALFGDLTSSVDVTLLANPLPGYRDAKIYYGQLLSVLAGNRTIETCAEFLPTDPILLQSTGRHFMVHCTEETYTRRTTDPTIHDYIALAREGREFGLTLAREMEAGTIRTVAIHGDTKLDNFLFSSTTGRVKAMVDLDTIMPHSWLADWGDMARSLVNVAGEKEPDMSRVQVDMSIYGALAAGFLGAAREVTPHEIDLMVDAVELIALELGVRFLTDYLRGDSYFQLGPADPPDLNKIRGMVQLTLFRRLRESAAECRACIETARTGAKIMRQLKIGTSWVRGVVGEALTPELIVNFACAFGTWCDGGTVVIARDTRRSSAMLHAAVVSGLLSTGCEVVDLEISPSPVVSFAVRELGAAGGISVSGSHNDVRWNALKFMGPDGVLLNAVKSEELLDIYHASAFICADWRALRPVTHDDTVADRYLEHLLSALDTEKIRSRGFRVALDLCNGACGPIAGRFMEALGCTIYKLNEEPSGEFAHLPAPSTDNMRQLAALMRCLDTDLGAAINVDGDRVGFVTRSGTALSEEYALPLAAQMRLARRPGIVVTNLSTSRMIDEVARQTGHPVLRTVVGEGYVMDQALAEGAVLVGEGSGGVAMLPVTMTFDALLTLGMILEALAASGLGLEDLVAGLPRMPMRKGELACPPDLVYKALEGFLQRFAERTPDCTDGVLVNWSDAWLHVRASNTEPLLRVIVEADTPERADQIFDDAMTYARRLAFGHVEG